MNRRSDFRVRRRRLGLCSAGAALRLELHSPFRVITSLGEHQPVISHLEPIAFVILRRRFVGLLTARLGPPTLFVRKGRQKEVLFQHGWPWRRCHPRARAGDDQPLYVALPPSSDSRSPSLLSCHSRARDEAFDQVGALARKEGRGAEASMVAILR
jgi:hypothetical protein